MKSSEKKANNSSGIFVVVQASFNSSPSQNLSCRPKSTIRSLSLMVRAADLTTSSGRSVLTTSVISSEEEKTSKRLILSVRQYKSDFLVILCLTL